MALLQHYVDRIEERIRSCLAFIPVSQYEDYIIPQTEIEKFTNDVLEDFAVGNVDADVIGFNEIGYVISDYFASDNFFSLKTDLEEYKAQLEGDVSSCFDKLLPGVIYDLKEDHDELEYMKKIF